MQLKTQNPERTVTTSTIIQGEQLGLCNINQQRHTSTGNIIIMTSMVIIKEHPEKKEPTTVAGGHIT